ncbi:MAG: hypothetical protein EOP07_17070 [Proteobacteria bacterium]|nr:MAG: hypothetical protein EOP07_17070 [Pseudomonadota bacterium]
MKRVRFWFFVLLSIGFVLFRMRFYKDYALVFNALSVVLILATVYGICRAIARRDRNVPLRVTLESLAKEKFGESFGGYLVYEVKLVIGLLKFLISPLRSYRGLMSSYFTSPMLSGVLFGLLFLMLCESLLIHLFISARFEGVTHLVLTLAFLLSEIFLLEMTIGNLYYFQFSKCVIADDKIEIRQGLLWDLEFEVEDIQSLEWGNLRKAKDKTPKISLFQDAVVRIHFKRGILAKRIFREKVVTSLDLFLKDVDQERLRLAMSARVAI